MSFSIRLVRNFTKSLYNAAQTLWMSTFGDSADFIGAVTGSESYYGAVVAECDGELAGISHLLRVSGERPGLYIYAVATDERYRNRGVCTEMLELLKTYSLGQGLSLLLHPADVGLASYYRRRGFVPLSYRICDIAEGDGGKYTEITAEEYLSVREFCFGGRGFYGWTEDVLSVSGLRFIAFDIDGEYCGAAINGATVCEICASPVSYGKAVRRAARAAGTASVMTLTDIPLGAEVAVMGYNCDDYSYFNLFLE